MLRNTSHSYGLVAIVLHWLIALLILSQLALGLVMDRLDDQRLAFELIQWHKSFGLLTLALVLLRLLWRFANPTPALPATTSRLEKKAARVAHGLLYGLMLASPLSGWIMVSVSVLAIPTYAFYLVIVPHLPLAVSEAAEMFWIATHRWLAYAALALVALHIAAALRHHLILRDDVLRRMLGLR